METAARLTLAISIALVGITVHLIAQVRAEGRVFFLALGREPTAADRARVRRTLWVNAVVTTVGVAISLLSTDVVLLTLVATIAPLIPVGWMIGEMVGLLRTLPPPTVPGRFLVPLDEPPPLSSYLSAPLAALNLAVIVITPAVFWLLRQDLPNQIPMHWDAAGNVNRWGSPNELWMFWGIQLFDYALLWLIAWSVTKERWVLSPNEPERYALLQRRRRTLLVRMVETMMLGLNVSFAIMWLGMAWITPAGTTQRGSRPGNGELMGALVVTSVAIMAVAVIGPLLGYLMPMVRVQNELKSLAGSDALGTRADGWRWRGLIYYSPDDPALFVPKRWGIGQTLNFARPGAWLFLAAVILLPLLLAAVSVLMAS